MKENRLTKWVVEEAMQVGKKSNWQKDFEKSLVELGWGGVKGEELEGLSMTEFGMMLRDGARREVKLSMWHRLGKTLCEMGCVKMLGIQLYIQINSYM